MSSLPTTSGIRQDLQDSGDFFLSPFPDERVKENQPKADKGLVLAQLLSEVFPGPMPKPDFRPGQDPRQPQAAIEGLIFETVSRATSELDARSVT